MWEIFKFSMKNFGNILGALRVELNNFKNFRIPSLQMVLRLRHGAGNWFVVNSIIYLIIFIIWKLNFKRQNWFVQKIGAFDETNLSSPEIVRNKFVSTRKVPAHHKYHFYFISLFCFVFFYYYYFYLIVIYYF